MDGERVFGAALWHSKPDFVSLLTQRFNDLPEEDEMGGDNAAAHAETPPKQEDAAGELLLQGKSSQAQSCQKS